MPKNIRENAKPKAGNAGGDAKEKDDASKQDAKRKESQKPNRDRPKSDILQHNGISSPNVNSWAAALNNPEVFSKLDLSLPWSSSLFKEGLDVSHIKRPTLIGGE